MMCEKINPRSANFIKLGSGGRFEKHCIEVAQVIRLGYNEIPHKLCLRGDWEAIREIFIQDSGSDPGSATRHTNQVKAYYEAGDDVLWVTFYNNHLWWCFARPEIMLLPDGSKTRPVKGSWCSTDIEGNPLVMDQLSGSLLSMQGFRGTTCSVREFDYLVRKINAEQSPTEQAALRSFAELVRALVAVIQEFNWKEFELLTDLIFRQAGWQRISQLGKSQKGIDLDLVSPIANERYYVQIKSGAGRKVFDDFIDITVGLDEYSRYYLVVHSPKGNLAKELETDTHKLWLSDDIARLVVRYGLVEWVMGKAK
jgi:hypothetical protein